MPYIIPQRRPQLDPLGKVSKAQNAGELNFQITRIVDAYLEDAVVPLNYADINEAIGALECAKLELYRRIAVPYEDEKRATNGDVYRSI